MSKGVLRLGIVTFLCCFLFFGCVIETQKGREIVVLDIPARNSDKDKQKKTTEEGEAKAQDEKPTTSAKDNELKNALSGSASEKTGEEADAVQTTPAEDFTTTPWWKKQDIQVTELDDKKGDETNSQPGELMILPATTEAPENTDDTKPESDSDKPHALIPEEPMVVSASKPAPKAPEKRIFQLDRHIQPISSSLWTSTYERQTSKEASPTRRAGMSKVKSAIETGYGKAYVPQLEKAISLDRGNGYAYYFLARGRFENGDWAGANNFADKSVQLLEPDRKFRACGRILLSKALANLGQIEKAAVQAREATIDDPQNTEAKILALKLE
jgi:hypothetical protein